MIASSDKLRYPNDDRGGRRGTKKERLLQLARSDPFLSVVEIAATVQTTPKYVRTALSEAGLSLNRLRRQHVQSIKQRYIVDAGQTGTGGAAPPLPAAFVETDGQPVTRSVRVAQIVDAEIASVLRAPPTAPLLEISRLCVVGERPLYVNQLVTTQHLHVTETTFTSDEPLVELLALKDNENTTLADRIFDVVYARDFLCESFQVSADYPLIRYGVVLTIGGEPIAIKFNYFDGTRVRLIMRNEPGSGLRVTERGAGG